MKPPEEKEPIVNWALDARNRLGLSAEQIAAATDYDDSSIRKFEGGSIKPSRPLRRRVVDYLQSEAASRGVTLPPLPDERQATTPGDVASAIRGQTAAMRELVEELREARQAQQGRDEGLAAALGALAETLERLRHEPTDRSH